jgi:protein-tyrosine-phosphatase/DNA-binding transcriptional ArsR family regulator
LTRPDSLAARAAIHDALGEPIRLAIVDRLVASDASPSQLADDLGVGSNLLAHHLRVLQQVGVIRRVASEGDRRRSYVQLRGDNSTVWAAALVGQLPDIGASPRRVLFVCTANSARSQLAAAQWQQVSNISAASAGTHPGPVVHPRAIATARRHGLDLAGHHPISLADVLRTDDLVVVVCDNAHEELATDLSRLHWSIPDPARVNTDTAFEDAYLAIRRRVQRLAELHSA